MAKSFIAIDHTEDQVASVTVGPAGHEAWFRMFRAVVHSGLWAQLSDAACRTYIVLAECVNDAMRRDNGEWLAWPSGDTLARRAGITRRSVFRATSELESRKLLERRRGGGRKSTQYCLLPPSKWDRPPQHHADTRPAVTPTSLVTPVSHVPPKSPVTTPAPQARPGRHLTGDLPFTQQRKKDRAFSDSSKALAALIEAGVGEPVLWALLKSHSQDDLLLRIEDWNLRNEIGPKRSVAWLISSIRNQYDLHPKTTAKIENQAKRESRVRAEHLKKQAEQDEQSRQARIDREVNVIFDSLSDDELSEWKDRAIAEYTPGLSRGLERADPRENEKLKRRILGLLSRSLSV